VVVVGLQCILILDLTFRNLKNLWVLLILCSGEWEICEPTC
jgi:hypothetical protein